MLAWEGCGSKVTVRRVLRLGSRRFGIPHPPPTTTLLKQLLSRPQTADVAQIMSEPTSPVKADRSTSAASPKATAAATTTPPSILTASKPPNKPPAATVEDASDSEDDQPVSSSTAVKGKGKATENEGARASAGPAAAAAPPAHDWQAVWSPAQNGAFPFLEPSLPLLSKGSSCGDD